MTNVRRAEDFTSFQTGYYQAYTGTFMPDISGYKESSNRSVEVNDAGYARPITLDMYIRWQLLQSRKKYFLFHEMYRRDSWCRGAIDFLVKRSLLYPNRLSDRVDPLNPDINDLVEFLEEPNPDTDFEDLTGGVYQDLLEYNQAYLYVERSFNGKVKHLWPMDARITFPVTDFHGTILFHAQAYNGFVQLFQTDEVIFFSRRNNGSDPKPIPCMETLVDSVAMELNANNYNAALFANDLNIGSIFSIPGAQDEEIEENLRYLNDQYSNPGNAHRPLILKGDTKLIRDGAQAAKDINFEQLIRLARFRVCAVFGVPESMLGIPDHTNRSTGQVHERGTYVNSIRPLRAHVCRQFTRQFIRRVWGSRSIRLVEPLNSLVPTDEEIDAVAKLAEIGGLFNDFLEMLGQERVPNGDYFVMKNPANGGMARLDEIMPGLGDPTFDFVAYQNLHEEQATQAAFYAKNGMQPPAPTSNIPWSPPRPQDSIQLETVASRIIDVSRSETEDLAGTTLARRVPMQPGTRGAQTLYTTKTGTHRYGTPPKQVSPLGPDGAPKQNTLVNPPDPPAPKRLSPAELAQMQSARSQVSTLFRDAQAQNWETDQFFSRLQALGWQPATDTRSTFSDRQDAYAEARRLGDAYPDQAFVVIGADGQYQLMQADLSNFDKSAPAEVQNVGVPGDAPQSAAPAKEPRDPLAGEDPLVTDGPNGRDPLAAGEPLVTDGAQGRDPLNYPEPPVRDPGSGADYSSNSAPGARSPYLPPSNPPKQVKRAESSALRDWAAQLTRVIGAPYVVAR